MRKKKDFINFSRHLRKNQTEAENILWEYIRNRKINGFKFRRQHPIGTSYIVDFFCPDKNLIIEVDGSIHNVENVKENDKRREEFLIKWGYKLIRFKNEDVLYNIKMVLDSIKNALN